MARPPTLGTGNRHASAAPACGSECPVLATEGPPGSVNDHNGRSMASALEAAAIRAAAARQAAEAASAATSNPKEPPAFLPDASHAIVRGVKDPQFGNGQGRKRPPRNSPERSAGHCGSEAGSIRKFFRIGSRRVLGPGRFGLGELVVFEPSEHCEFRFHRLG